MLLDLRNPARVLSRLKRPLLEPETSIDATATQGQWAYYREDGTIEALCTVYMPTNHLYVGDVVVLPADDVIETDLSIEDGISLILSAGASVPGAIGQRGSDAGG